jgi:hypothetical protein
MNHVDGHLFVMQDPKTRNNVSCTRWEEATSTLKWHANFCQKVEAPMVIRLVNDPGANVGPQQLGAEHAKIVVHSRPGGNTPLAIHLKDILASLQLADPKCLKDKQISMMIVTDGLPTDSEGEKGEDVNKEFVDTLYEFQTFPVSIVVRLLTNEQQVVDFYRNLERQGDNLTVIGDFLGEAKLVAKHNPWLNYAYPLHLSRESGMNIAAIHDRSLDFNELANSVAVLFDRNANALRPFDGTPLSNPQTDYQSFRQEAEEDILRVGGLWNPVRKKVLPWIDLKELDRMYASGGPVPSATVESKVLCSCQIL